MSIFRRKLLPISRSVILGFRDFKVHEFPVWLVLQLLSRVVGRFVFEFTVGCIFAAPFLKIGLRKAKYEMMTAGRQAFHRLYHHELEKHRRSASHSASDLQIIKEAWVRAEAKLLKAYM